MIVITHDNGVVERMNKRVVELKNGRVVADTAWTAAEKATESVQPVPDNADLAAPAPAVEPVRNEEAPAAPVEEPEAPAAPESEEDSGYVQETLDLSTPEEEEEPEQVVMDLEAITPPQPKEEPLPELPKLVVPTVELPESESARKSRVVSAVLKGWTAQEDGAGSPGYEMQKAADGEENTPAEEDLPAGAANEELSAAVSEDGAALPKTAEEAAGEGGSRDA